MKPEEMPVELLTEPITHFGLYADVLPFSVIPESECIIVDMSIRRRNDRPILFPLPNVGVAVAQPRRLLFTAICLRRAGQTNSR